MDARRYLRLEGGTVLVAALAAYVEFGGPLWLLAALALAPDLSMLGYLRGPRIGALVYNAVHTYVLPLVLALVGWVSGTPLALQVAAVWTGHIGADRLAGFGLKSPAGFRYTHLGPMAAPEAFEA